MSNDNPEAGDFKISDDELPGDWTAHQEDPWTIVVEHDKFDTIAVFFSGSERFQYSISLWTTDGVPEHRYHGVPDKQELFDFIEKVEN